MKKNLFNLCPLPSDLTLLLFTFYFLLLHITSLTYDLCPMTQPYYLLILTSYFVTYDPWPNTHDLWPLPYNNAPGPSYFASTWEYFAINSSAIVTMSADPIKSGVRWWRDVGCNSTIRLNPLEAFPPACSMIKASGLHSYNNLNFPFGDFIVDG